MTEVVLRLRQLTPNDDILTVHENLENNLVYLSEILTDFGNSNNLALKEIYNFSIVTDELVNIVFKELNEGKEENVIKQHILNYSNNNNYNIKEICNWLLNNQESSNSIFFCSDTFIIKELN